MGGAAPSRPSPTGDISKHKIAENHEFQDNASSCDSKRITSVGDNAANVSSSELKHLALGDTTSPVRNYQSRDYDRKLGDIKKRPHDVEWNEAAQLSDDKRNTRSSNSIKKYPESLNIGYQQHSLSKKPPPPALKPKPPSDSPHHTAQRKPIGHNVVYAPEKRTPTTKTYGRYGGQQGEHVGQINRELSVNSKSGVDELPNDHKAVHLDSNAAKLSTSSYVDSFNILGGGQDDGSDSPDSDNDEYAEQHEGCLYDWTSSDTPRSKRDAVDGSGLRDSAGLDATTGTYSAKAGDASYEIGTHYTHHQRRPDNVPRLTIPSQCLSAGTPPPKQPHPMSNPGIASKPNPPPKSFQGLAVSTGKGQSTPSNATGSSVGSVHRGTPVSRQAPHNTPPTRAAPSLSGSVLLPDGAKRTYTLPHHQVKETKDVKRNRAQLPSTLTHAKPTTGDWLKKRYIVNNYILLDILGTGSYGEVRLCKDRTTDNLYAVKILSKEMLKKKKGGNTTETYFEDIKREIAIMKKLQHPNVLRLFEVLDDPKVNKMYLVLEYMKRGDLINYIKKREDLELKDGKRKNSKAFNPLTDSELWVIFKEVVAGVRYLHLQNIVHGDIKPQNILVGEDGIVKIADFGISKMLENGSAQKLVDAAGTPAFMAPELCSAEVAFSGQLADIWAIGATMYMLRFGVPPFVAGNIMALYHKIVNDQLEFPNIPIDPGLRNLLVNMLEKSPKLRYTMDQVITHPWLRVAPSPPVGKKLAESRDASIANTRSLRGGTLQFTEKYLDEEAEAMNGPVKTVDKEDLFRSIGFGVGKNVQSDGEDEEDGSNEDIMASNWALDVFEKVDDEDIESDDDDDSAVDSDRRRESSKGEEAVCASKPTLNAVRVGMEEKEEARRSKEFKKKHIAKSNIRNVQGSDHHVKFGEVTDLGGSPSPPRGKSNPSIDRESSNGYLSEAVEEISMNDFEKMMDTLAMRPLSKNASRDSDDSGVSQTDDAIFSMSSVVFSPRLLNGLNGVVAVHHSEQGCRKSQEDRCILSISLLPTVRGYPDMGSWGISSSDIEHLSCISLSAVFDGHSGQKCAHYLSENMIRTLVLKKHFYSPRTQQIAIREAFAEIDRKVCENLRSDDDSSGSTGTVVIYDGRSRVLTVASVGDSQCILCRGGKAVKIHPTHRVGESQDELDRIKKAGGSVVNRRVNGVLAISRAFGDTAFKDMNGDSSKSPVIAIPELTSEMVTPMTEFCIVASDGLWDVAEPQWVVNFVRKKIKNRTSVSDICRCLCDEALEKGSIDNISSVITLFHMST